MNYNKIINPLTNEKLSIFSTEGKNLLKQYIKQYNKVGGNHICNICREGDYCDGHIFTMILYEDIDGKIKALDPSFGDSIPMINFSRVDFPAPFGPINAILSPDSISRFASKKRIFSP